MQLNAVRQLQAPSGDAAIESCRYVEKVRSTVMVVPCARRTAIGARVAALAAASIAVRAPLRQRDANESQIVPMGLACGVGFHVSVAGSLHSGGQIASTDGEVPYDSPRGHLISCGVAQRPPTRHWVELFRSIQLSRLECLLVSSQ